MNRTLLMGIGIGLSLGAQVFTSDVRLVVVDASVRNQAGQPVSGLTRDCFRILDEGRATPLTLFSNLDRAVTLGVLVDASRSMVPRRDEVRKAAQTLVAESNPGDELFVVNFSDTVQMGLPSAEAFTSNARSLTTAIDRVPPPGMTSLHDALMSGLDHLQLGKQERKVLLIISDGADNASRAKASEALTRAEEAAVTIYVVSLCAGVSYGCDSGFLKRLAGRTGGEYLEVDAGMDLESACRRIAHDIRIRYTLGFAGAEPKGKAISRRIRVEAACGDWTVRARSHYRVPAKSKVGSP